MIRLFGGIIFIHEVHRPPYPKKAFAFFFWHRYMKATPCVGLSKNFVKAAQNALKFT